MRTLFIITVLALASGVRMESCPSDDDIRPCQCYIVENGDVAVRCDDKSLVDHEVFRKMLSSLTGKQNVRLELRNFYLGRVPHSLFQGIDIKWMSISSCYLDSLSDGEGPAFQGLEDTLVELVITKSFTEYEVPAKLQLGHLNRLTHLTLDDNTITEIGDDWFENGPTSLEALVITDNQIEKIGQYAFASLTNLKYLFVNGNRFRQIQRSMFPSPANKLELLSLLDNTALTVLPEDIFTNFPVLNDVQINRSGIKSLDERVWGDIWQQLRYVSLAGNPIRCDERMNWLFNRDDPVILTGECDSPEEVRGVLISDFIKRGRQ